ncbi:hypothetical protein D3C86_1986180 [compost metagenome]
MLERIQRGLDLGLVGHHVASAGLLGRRLLLATGTALLLLLGKGLEATRDQLEVIDGICVLGVQFDGRLVLGDRSLPARLALALRLAQPVEGIALVVLHP